MPTSQRPPGIRVVCQCTRAPYWRSATTVSWTASSCGTSLPLPGAWQLALRAQVGGRVLVGAQLTVAEAQVLEPARGHRVEPRAPAAAALDRDLAAGDQAGVVEAGEPVADGALARRGSASSCVSSEGEAKRSLAISSRVWTSASPSSRSFTGVRQGASP